MDGVVVVVVVMVVAGGSVGSFVGSDERAASSTETPLLLWSGECKS